MRADSLIALALGAAMVTDAASASAYCRTTTCDTNDPEGGCIKDREGCETTGRPLYWPERCVSFGVHQDGSPRHNVTFPEATAVIQQAYRQWMSAECPGGGRPSFEIWDLGAPYGGLLCDVPEFNENEPNANTWIFRDREWPYRGADSTLALTTITFEVPTGEILDADVEVNSFSNALTTSSTNVESDLLSIATHEAGHFMGLAHSSESDATMDASYSPGRLEFRTLHADDVAGICAVYPPDRRVPDCSAPRPRHGFTRYCAEPAPEAGCAQVRTPRTASGTGLSALGALTSLLWLRRRRSERTVQPVA